MNLKLLHTIASVATALLIILFTYTAFAKLATWEDFTKTINFTLQNQTATTIAATAIIAAEAITSALLFAPQTRTAGMKAAGILMLTFTLYIAGMLLFASKLPCSCGGVISKMSWKQHLIFNASFLAIAITGWIAQSKIDKRFIAINRTSRTPI